LLKKTPSQRYRINREFEEVGTTCGANPATYYLTALLAGKRRLWQMELPGNVEEKLVCFGLSR
jgi:hypothetical protein